MEHERDTLKGAAFAAILVMLFVMSMMWVLSSGLGPAAAQGVAVPPTFPQPAATASPPATPPPVAAPAVVAPAAPAAPAVADFSWIFNYLIEALASVLLVVAMFFIRKVNAMFSLNLDTKRGSMLYEGIDNILDGTVAYVHRKGGDLAKFETQSTIAHMAAQLVSERLPGVVKGLKLTPQDIEERVAQRLERRLPGAEPGMLPNGGLIVGGAVVPPPTAPAA